MKAIIFTAALLLIPGLFVWAMVQTERKQRELTERWAASHIHTGGF